MNTLQAISQPTEVNVMIITFDNQKGLHPLCENHSTIYLFLEGVSAIQVDIRAHCQSFFGWGLCIGYQMLNYLYVVNGMKKSLQMQKTDQKLVILQRSFTVNA